MSAVIQGVRLQCDKCGYLTDATFNDAQHARDVLGGRGWKCLRLPAVVGPDVLRDFCRLCIISGRIESELREAKAK